MMATRILNGLELCAATGEEAESVARLEFLEWVFGLDGAATPAEARAALATPAAQRAESDAACAFVGFLRQASRPVSRPATKGARRGRRRTVH